MLSLSLSRWEEYQKKDELSICPGGFGFSGVHAYVFGRNETVFRPKN